MEPITKIRNQDALLQHGDKAAREAALGLLNRVLEDVDAGRCIRKQMRLEGDTLWVGERSWDLRNKRNIYLFGAGKACNAMAQAVCDILGRRITKGIIAVKIAEANDRYVNTDVYVGGHPLPNAEGMEAARAMLSMIENAAPGDLFISVISGGSSYLLTYPVDGISLEDEITAQDMLLKTGANIVEINAVRRHISRTNGGRMAEKIMAAGAELINLFASDSVGIVPAANRGIPVTAAGTPVAADNTTIQDARDMILKYGLKDTLPVSIIDYLWDDARVRETPKVFNERVTSFRVCVVSDLCEAAVRGAEAMGIPIMVLTSCIEGESREAGVFLSTIVREIRQWGRPIAAPCFIVCAGETTVRVVSPPEGMGGPSQELALSVAEGIRGMTGVACAAVDTDGTDGPTLYAGGLVDGQTVERLLAQGINADSALKNHSAGDALKQAGDLIFTGNTGTNLCDLNIIYIAKD